MPEQFPTDTGPRICERVLNAAGPGMEWRQQPVGAAADEVARFEEIDAAVVKIVRTHATAATDAAGYLRLGDPWTAAAWDEVVEKVVNHLPSDVWAQYDRWREDEAEHADLVADDPENRAAEIRRMKLHLEAMRLGGHATIGDLVAAAQAEGIADLYEYIRVHSA